MLFERHLRVDHPWVWLLPSSGTVLSKAAKTAQVKAVYIDQALYFSPTMTFILHKWLSYCL